MERDYVDALHGLVHHDAADVDHAVSGDGIGHEHADSIPGDCRDHRVELRHVVHGLFR